MKKSYDFSRGIKNPYVDRVRKVEAMDADSLTQQIDDAFAEMSPPTSHAAPHDCDECDEISAYFKGLRRESIDDATIHWFANGPTGFLAVEHREYYLPVLMKRSLEPGQDELRRGVLILLVDVLPAAVAAIARPRRAAIIAYLEHLKSKRLIDERDGLLRSVIHHWTQEWKR